MANPSFIQIAIPAILAIIIIGVAIIVIWIWALVKCLASDLRPVEKLFWAIIIIFLNIIGAILYLIFAKSLESKAHEQAKQHKQAKVKLKLLTRSKDNKMLAGVCGGIGEYLNIDPTVIRLLWVLFTILSMGAAIIAYILAWMVMPEK